METKKYILKTPIKIQKKNIIQIETYKGILATEVHLTTACGVTGKWLLCEVPSKIREYISKNS